ncbi:MAG: aminopeptidase P family N-terminal domain-containing protein, partial [Candidatus Limnocylindrales bacterium]
MAPDDDQRRDPAPVIPAARYAERLARAQSLAARHGFAAMLIGVGADLRYLTGYAAMPLERLTMLVVPAVGAPALVAPRLEAMAAVEAPGVRAGRIEVLPWDETDDAHSLLVGLVGDAGSAPDARILVSDRLWAMHVLGIQRVLPAARLGLATEVLR